MRGGVRDREDRVLVLGDIWIRVGAWVEVWEERGIGRGEAVIGVRG